MRTTAALLALALPALAACAPRIVALERPSNGPLELAVGVLPVPPNELLSARKAAGLNAALAGRMDRLGVLASVEPVATRRAEGVDLVLDIDPLSKRTWTVTVRALSARTGRLLHTYSPKLPFNEPGGLSPEGIANGLLAAFSPGGPGARALQAERVKERPAPPAPAPAPVASAPAAAPPAPEARDSEVDLPRRRHPERPDDLAVVIGVENYSDLPPAAHARRDAEAVKRHLLALGVPERNLVHLSDARAGKSALEKNLEVWLPNNARENSRVFVYFSGHGAPEPRSGRAYLAPWDADPSYLESTGYPLSRLYESLSRLKAKSVLVALDACFSGAGGRSVLAKGARPLVAKSDATQAPSGLAVLAAASGDQITSSLDDEGHGAFTYYLLKGLDGAAADARGRVTADGLMRYLAPKVADAARRQNREQTPVRAGPDLTIAE